MRAHSTTSSSWHRVERVDQVDATFKKELVCVIEGCPYEINMEIILTEVELLNLGYGMDYTEDRIAYGLLMQVPEKEVQVNFVLWDRIERVYYVMESDDTSSWGVKEWDAACPFLFEGDPGLDDEEALQEERETWI